MSQRDFTGTAGVLGNDAIPGDPDTVGALSRLLMNVADEVERAKRDLAASSDDAGWKGDAADAFRGTLQTLPDEFEKVHSSYHAAGNALRDYNEPYRTLQNQSVQQARALTDALDRLAAVERARSSGQAAANPDYWNHEEQQAQADRDQAQAAAHTTRLDFEALVSTCLNGIHNASDLGIKNDLGSWWQRYAVDDVGATAWNIGSGIVHAFADLPGELVAFVEHPSWDGFWKIVRDLSIVLTVLALVLPFIGELALIGLATKVVGVAAKAVNVAQAAHDGYDVATGDVATGHEDKRLALASDLLAFIPAGAASRAGKQADAAAADSALNSQRAWRADQRLAFAKADAAAAKSNLKDLNRQANRHGGGWGSNTIEQAKQDLKRAKQELGAAGVDKGTVRVQITAIADRADALKHLQEQRERIATATDVAKAGSDVAEKSQDVQQHDASEAGQAIRAGLPHGP